MIQIVDIKYESYSPCIGGKWGVSGDQSTVSSEFHEQGEEEEEGMMMATMTEQQKQQQQHQKYGEKL